MRSPLGPAQSNLEVKKSRFIALAYPCQNLAEIKTLVTATKNQHPEANHVVHAAVIGPNGDEFSCSDDHEPKNTAGRPTLEVLKGSGITNIVILVIRYFGGTLLGTGGLVKAYAESAKKVLEILETEELVEKCSFSLSTSYDLFEPVKKALLSLDCSILEEHFGSAVTIAGTLPVARKAEVENLVTETSNGRNRILFSE
jgi:uncharacterized YigZ family protein